MNQNTNPALEEDTIDIIALLKKFWKGRRFVIKTLVIFTIIGFFIAIFSKNTYTASSTIVPVTEGKSVSSNLGSLASLAGINLSGAGNSAAEISPTLYPKIVNSIPFQLELLKTPLTIEGQDSLVSYQEYFETIYNPGVLATLKKYTIGLPGLLISFAKGSDDEAGIGTSKSNNQIIRISAAESDLIKLLESQINLEVNAKEGFISIAVTLPEPEASAQLALRSQQLLQQYALQFKTQKSKEQLNYIEERYLEKQQEFNDIKLKLALFQDQNNDINTAVAKTKLLQLQSDYDLAFTVYTELAKQLETQRLQVKKDTPIFTILKPVTIPKEKTGPKRALILIIYMFLGIVFSLGYLLLKDWWIDFKKQWTAKEA